MLDAKICFDGGFRSGFFFYYILGSSGVLLVDRGGEGKGASFTGWMDS